MIFGRRKTSTLLLAVPFVFFFTLWFKAGNRLTWSAHSSFNDVDQDPDGLVSGPEPPPPEYEDNPKFIWRTLEVNYPVSSIRPFPSGRPKAFPKVQKASWSESTSDREIRLGRQKEVKKAFTRCWKSYHAKAWKTDELAPVSGQSRDHFGGWGATLVDALDTLYIMDLGNEFEDAVTAAAKIDFGSTTAEEINVFETTIRYLGGFLAAYDLSGDPRLLKKAREVGDLIYKSFDTPNRMPLTRWPLHGAVNGITQDAASNTLLAEIGSLTMEFTRLSMVTGDMKYFDAVQRIMDLFYDQQDTGQLPGLWPIVVNAKQGQFNVHNDFSLNAMADSMYEYLAKTHILVGGLLPMYEEMYKKAMDTAMRFTLFRPMLPEENDILISGSVKTTSNGEETVAELNTEGQHLACFTGGMFALGGKLYNLKDHLEAGRKLVDGCIWAYESMPNGIMPETFHMIPCESATTCPWNETVWRMHFLARAGIDEQIPLEQADDLAEKRGVPKGMAAVGDPHYHLRPEAIESIFILYRITGRPDLLDKAWEMWEAIESHTRTEFANSALTDITTAPPPKSDVMESFWLGETLKYFYLIFSEPDLISLDEYVFNTEAHPFKRYLP